MNESWYLKEVSVTAAGERNKKILDQINVDFPEGKITLLLGCNGSGKSTLLETVAGLRIIAEGEIKQGELSLWDKGRRRPKLNQAMVMGMGIALQQSESQWFAETVRAEFHYSLKPYKLVEAERDRRIKYAMEQADLPVEWLERDPWTLSGGQQRRLSLACLLACEPQWLLLDEPTAGLDADGIQRLCALLEAHRRAGRGAVVATHDLDALLPLADEVVVLADGRIREAAPAASW
ncbi:MAG: energy-coupling factor ABC transporter ATP-binding protein, partial [Candidatus Pristimantibacillus sp.]